MLYQPTAGLIDEAFGLHNGYIELPHEIVIPAPPPGKQPAQKLPPGKKVKYPLNNNEKLFAEIRNMNFSNVGTILSRKAHEIDQSYKVHLPLLMKLTLRHGMKQRLFHN